MIGGKRITPDYTLQVDFGSRGSASWNGLYFFVLKTTNQKFKTAAEAEESWLQHRHWQEGKLAYDEKGCIASTSFSRGRSSWGPLF
jgi:hypothetical protein